VPDAHMLYALVLNEVGALVLNEVGGEVNDADVVALCECALHQ
jgi:hypothetical protein